MFCKKICCDMYFLLHTTTFIMELLSPTIIGATAARATTTARIIVVTIVIVVTGRNIDGRMSVARVALLMVIGVLRFFYSIPVAYSYEYCY